MSPRPTCGACPHVERHEEDDSGECWVNPPLLAVFKDATDPDAYSYGLLVKETTAACIHHPDMPALIASITPAHTVEAETCVYTGSG